MLPAAILYASAFAAGLCAIWKGRRTAWPLLVSLALCKWLDHEQVAFNFFFWLMIDLTVILTLWYIDVTRKSDHEALTRQDLLIIILFPVAWAFYAISDGWVRAWGSWAVVVAQFWLTLPLADIVGIAARFWQGRKAEQGNSLDVSRQSYC